MDATAFKLHPNFRRACVTLIIIGCAYRIGMAWRLPVSYDEVFVIALGLEEIRDGGSEQWLEVPLRRSAAITPLWWWFMAVPTKISGELSLVAIRTFPLLLGLLTPLAAWLASRRRFGSEAALLFATLFAVSDILAFSNVRGEYFETLLTLFTVLALAQLGDWRQPWVKGLVWLGLLMTFFGKGLVILAFAIMAEWVVILWQTRDSPSKLQSFARAIKPLLPAMAISILPILLYFVMADRYLDRLESFKHASLDSKDVWELAYDTTLGYSQTRSHMIADMGHALQVFWDAQVWPITSLLALPLLLALGLSAWLLIFKARPSEEGKAAEDFHLRVCGLLAWTVMGLGLVVAGGKVGARFHLLYLPAAWLLASIIYTHANTWRLLGRYFPLRFCFLLFWAFHIGFAWSILAGATGESSRGKLLTVFLLASALAISLDLIYWRSVQIGCRSIAAFAVAVLCACMILAGPWQWGMWSRFEPMAGHEDLTVLDDYRKGNRPAPTPERGTLNIYLTNYYTQNGDTTRALRFGEQATRQTPENVLAWTYLGFAYDAAEKPVEDRRRVWEKALSLKPESDLLKQKLQEIMGSGSSPRR